jgi:hypothetical protein
MTPIHEVCQDTFELLEVFDPVLNMGDVTAGHVSHLCTGERVSSDQTKQSANLI